MLLALVAAGCSPAQIDPIALPNTAVEVFCILPDGTPYGTGSGFLVGDRKTIVTNRHVAFVNESLPCDHFRVRVGARNAPGTDRFAVLSNVNRSCEALRKALRDAIPGAAGSATLEELWEYVARRVKPPYPEGLAQVAAFMKQLQEAGVTCSEVASQFAFEKGSVVAGMQQLPRAQRRLPQRYGDAAIDLAVLEADDELDLQVLDVMSVDPPIGLEVWAVGFPGNVDQLVKGASGRSPQATASSGKVEALPIVSSKAGKSIQHGAPISHGNSGGPLLDRCGRVVGVNTWGGDDTEHYWAVTASAAHETLERWGVSHGATAAACIPDQGGREITLALAISGVLLAAAALGVAARKGKVREVSTRLREASTRALRGTRPVPPSRTGTVQMRGTAGEFAGSEIPLGENWLVLGRDPQRSNLVFPLVCEEVSRVHCRIRVDRARDGIVVEDLGSSGGTFVKLDGGTEGSPPKRLQPNKGVVVRRSCTLLLGGTTQTLRIDFP